jgi:hypothetical protein
LSVGVFSFVVFTFVKLSFVKGRELSTWLAMPLTLKRPPELLKFQKWGGASQNIS